MDVRPGTDPGRAAPEHYGAYRVTAVSLALYAGALIAWMVHGITQGDGGVGDFLEGLFNPGASTDPHTLGPYEWSFTAMLLVVAGLALAQRRMARSAALLSAVLLLAGTLPEAVGLFDAGYRNGYRSDPLGGWELATHGLGLVVAVSVLCAMLPAAERRGGPGTDRRAVGPEACHRRASVVSGVLFVVLGLARLGWTVRTLTHGELEVSHYLRGVVDGSVVGTPGLAPPAGFTTVSSVVVLLVLGLLALRARHDVRGALLVFAGVELYMTVRTVVGLTVTGYFNRSFETTEGALSMATTAYALAAMTSVVVLATGRGSGPYGGQRAEGFRTAQAGRS
ncbi:hypothetical protein [Streptomyces sp. NBRC 110611]|uniref:hypothetical protein n=1 Tax=Streptomyces sp. NBRC 110611 TaxID=1621259 RepID=UPI00215BBC4B|nr:hypothetical protein [Streptomyces sp. NBRC 110611]